jgi:endoglucanase
MKESKRLLLFPFLMLLLTTFLSSCKNETVVNPELVVAKESLSFTKDNGTALLPIRTNVAWTATSSQTWCTLTLASGEAGTVQISVAVTANSTPSDREALITITAGSLTKEVKVTQKLKNFLVLEHKNYTATTVGGDITVNVQSGLDYTTTIPQDWLVLKSTSVDKKTQVFTISENPTTLTRTGLIIYASENLKDTVKVVQTGKDLSIAADATGMASTSKVLAAKIFAGWNLGNTMEAIGSETASGNPKATKALIDAVKAAGFNAIRIPCSWNSYIEDQTTYRIKDSWLSRVKEVVDYCVDNNLYVILNIHWDGGWLENNPTYAKQVSVNAKQKALWEQIAVYFRGYDEHLLFAGTNEVHVDYNAPSTENITVQQSYNQTFVDAVRSTGGKNAYRNLIIQSYNTNIGHAVSYLKVPTDKITTRLMVEVHYYDPWEFAGDEKSSIYLWGASNSSLGSISSWGQESYVQEQFGKMKTNFVDKGYPVILGEYGAIRRSSLTGTALTNHLASRAYYLQYVTEQAKKNGMVPFYWDNGYTSNFGFALFNRTNATVFDQKALDALISGASAGVYPF